MSVGTSSLITRLTWRSMESIGSNFESGYILTFSIGKCADLETNVYLLKAHKVTLIARTVILYFLETSYWFLCS